MSIPINIASAFGRKQQVPRLGRREIVLLAKRVFVFGGDIAWVHTDVVREWITEGEWTDRPELLDDETMNEIMEEACQQGMRVERFLGLRNGGLR